MPRSLDPLIGQPLELLCIGGDFSKFDAHAVKQISRNIELLRYRKFGDDLLMLELVHALKVAKITDAPIAIDDKIAAATPSESTNDPYISQRIGYRPANASSDLRDLFQAINDYLVSLGDDVQVKELKYYVAFKRIKNFCCLEVYPHARVVTAYVKVDPQTVSIESGFTRDVREIGQFGTGDLEVSMKTLDDFTKAQPLFQRAYDGG